jgi:hypothetical protein
MIYIERGGMVMHSNKNPVNCAQIIKENFTLMLNFLLHGLWHEIEVDVLTFSR